MVWMSCLALIVLRAVVVLLSLLSLCRAGREASEVKLKTAVQLQAFLDIVRVAVAAANGGSSAVDAVAC